MPPWRWRRSESWPTRLERSRECRAARAGRRALAGPDRGAQPPAGGRARRGAQRGFDRAAVQVLDESFSCTRRLAVFATTPRQGHSRHARSLAAEIRRGDSHALHEQPARGVAEELDALCAELSPIRRHVCPDPRSAWKLAAEIAHPEHLICITGSFFIAADMCAAMRASDE